MTAVLSDSEGCGLIKKSGDDEFRKKHKFERAYIEIFCIALCSPTVGKALLNIHISQSCVLIDAFWGTVATGAIDTASCHGLQSLSQNCSAAFNSILRSINPPAEQATVLPYYHPV
jgi:hypothetical protein